MAGKMMDYHEGECYEVHYMGGNGGLIITTEEQNSVEGCRRAIDRRNSWAEGNSAAADIGCHPEQFVIVKHIWNKCFFPDGTFYEENHKTRMVEIYPAEI